ncbi:ATP-dependent DNA helicase [Trichonephila clavipes]|uniref:ATP-dependent DNA helicase n=1 Tax=Trichonephila clavipes TaxID=2585209 RepID=A0A8X6VQ72_TRICX|nr:ATP-dependent DNA helicase [Trichonephila clavipes]
MHERIQDAMTYVQHFGQPDLFITFMCNPKWSEIVGLLNQGQKLHDIIARVFRVKVKHMMKFLTKGCIFGNVMCHMYTVEWLKCSLPHVHILLWLKDKIRPESIDKVICAELPNSNLDPALYEIIRTTMIHGPCGHINKSSPCMLNGICMKKYPRCFRNETQTGEDGYPQYCRSLEDGEVVRQIKENNVDNRRSSPAIIPSSLQSSWLAGKGCSLEEASISESPNKIREFFAIILVFCQVGVDCSPWLKERAILTRTNDSVNNINNFLSNKLTTKHAKYESVDSVMEAEDAVHYPVKFLNTLNPTGIPPHVLNLKIEAPIMLLHNLNPLKLCNGTKPQVKNLHNNVIEAMILTGKYEEEIVFIPRIPLIPFDYHFEFNILLQFAMA